MSVGNQEGGRPDLGARRFPRVSTYKHARIETENDPTISISGVVFEIGAQGCGVRSEGELEPGSTVKVSLYDQSRLDPVIFLAKIVNLHFLNLEQNELMYILPGLLASLLQYLDRYAATDLVTSCAYA